MEYMIAFAHFPIFSFRLDDRLLRLLYPFRIVLNDLLASGVGGGMNALRDMVGSTPLSMDERGLLHWRISICFALYIHASPHESLMTE